MKQVDRIYKALAEGVVTFTEGHAIHTPRALVEEILGKIKLRGNILVMFNIEFVVSLVYTYNIDPKTITFYSDSEDKTEFAKNLGVKYITTLGTDMKFDVVLANPPYTSENAKIYQHFYNRAVSLLTTNGTIGFVAPFAIARGFVGRKVGDVTLDCTDLVLLNNDNIKQKYFPKVGIDNICYLIVNEGYKGLADIHSDGGTKQIDLNTLSTFPVVLNDKVLSIVQKCFDNNRNYLRRSNYHKKDSNKTSNGTFVLTKIKEDKTLEGYHVATETNGMSGKPRIFINTLGKRAVVDLTHNMLMKPDGTTICIETTSDQESANLVFLLENNQKLIDFMSKCVVGNARSPYDTFLINLKKVDLKKKWTDQKLYKHFGLTVDEIAYIESNS
jgi:hypothetical protein